MNRDGVRRFERKRHAPSVGSVSDLTRFHGVFAGAFVAATVAVVGLVVDSGAGAPGSPGPLSPSHERAGVACAACHAREEPAEACASCHGAHASTRPAHATLARAGKLTCRTCHRAHGPDSARFETSGALVLTLGGETSNTNAFIGGLRPAAPLTIPLVSARACGTCHALDRRDRAGSCLSGASSLAVEATPIVCFDEHRSAAEPVSVTRDGPATASRDAARAALLEAIARGRVRLDQRSLGSSWIFIGAAAVFGLFVTRAFRRNPMRRAPPSVPAAADKGPEPRRVALPQIDANTCLGCYACVDACPYDVLEVQRYVARVVRPAACCGLVTCEERCPNGSLVVRHGPALAPPAALSSERESLQVPGLFLAGDARGSSLIRSAIADGESAARVVKERLRAAQPKIGIVATLARRLSPAAPVKSDSMLDVLIVGGGPAGLAAALEAKALGLTARIVEQSSVAESIKSFPRGKLVLDRGNATPSGKLWLEECTKEALVAKWLRTVRRAKLDVSERTRVIRIEPAGEGTARTFHVHARTEEGAMRLDVARHVIVAIGKRGSPRKLAVPIAAQSRVHYHLADARSFAHQRAVIVGLGDVAMEAAIALSRQAGTSVTVIHRSNEFTRGSARNVAAMRELMAAGKLHLHFSAEVRAVSQEHVVFERQSQNVTLGYDALFVLIGSELARDPLFNAGG